MHNNHHSTPKAILLSLGILLMLPVASSWQNMFGSVGKAIGHSITVDSALEEKTRMEEEMEKMQEQMEKLTALIERLDQQEVSE